MDYLYVGRGAGALRHNPGADRSGRPGTGADADADVCAKIDRAININEVCNVNPFGVEALIAAYDHGEEWLEALNRYLSDNYTYLKAYFRERLSQFPVTELEGTYLVWADCSALGHTSEAIARRLLEQEKLRVNARSMYGAAGEGFIRINFTVFRRAIFRSRSRPGRG